MCARACFYLVVLFHEECAWHLEDLWTPLSSKFIRVSKAISLAKIYLIYFVQIFLFVVDALLISCFFFHDIPCGDNPKQLTATKYHWKFLQKHFSKYKKYLFDGNKLIIFAAVNSFEDYTIGTITNSLENLIVIVNHKGNTYKIELKVNNANMNLENYFILIFFFNLFLKLFTWTFCELPPFLYKWFAFRNPHWSLL